MKRLVISNTAHQAIGRCARPEDGFGGPNDSSKQLLSGDWNIELSEESLNGLEDFSFENESISDALIRLCSVKVLQ